MTTLKVIAIAALFMCVQEIAVAAGWEIDSSIRCPDVTSYAVRDSGTLKGSLAPLTSAMVAQRKVDGFVTGTCDATGMATVIGIILHS